MNDSGSLVGFGILAVGIVLSRILSERAFRKLDDEMKIAVMNEFSGMRIWNIVPMLALVIILFAGKALYAKNELIVFSLFLMALIAYFLIMHRVIRAKLLNAHAPEAYIRSTLVARWISYLTMLLMLGTIMGTHLF
ncbi:MAG: hypothetical protein WCJ02_03850 [bacterium]